MTTSEFDALSKVHSLDEGKVRRTNVTVRKWVRKISGMDNLINKEWAAYKQINQARMTALHGLGVRSKMTAEEAKNHLEVGLKGWFGGETEKAQVHKSVIQDFVDTVTHILREYDVEENADLEMFTQVDSKLNKDIEFMAIQDREAMVNTLVLGVVDMAAVATGLVTIGPIAFGYMLGPTSLTALFALMRSAVDRTSWELKSAT